MDGLDRTVDGRGMGETGSRRTGERRWVQVDAGLAGWLAGHSESPGLQLGLDPDPGPRPSSAAWRQQQHVAVFHFEAVGSVRPKKVPEARVLFLNVPERVERQSERQTCETHPWIPLYSSLGLWIFPQSEPRA